MLDTDLLTSSPDRPGASHGTGGETQTSPANVQSRQQADVVDPATTGEHQTGEQQTGEQQTGEQQVRERPGGQRDVGGQQSGDQQSGDQQSGDQQSGDRQSGWQLAAFRGVIGGVLSVAGLASWIGWLSWRFTHVDPTLISVFVLALEVIAFTAAIIVTAGLYAGRPPWRRDRRKTDADRQLPVLLAEALDLGHIVREYERDAEATGSPGADHKLDSGSDHAALSASDHAANSGSDHAALSASDTGPAVRAGGAVCRRGPDDTGEIAWARRGIRVLGDQRRLDHRAKLSTQNLREAAWSIVALDGLRRLVSVIALVAVLFSGTAPFDVPPTSRAIVLGAGLALLSCGHWLLSGGHVRPVARLIWSMASIGAGLGDGVSRSGLPIRWAMTMATLIILNISIALRGMSDRWTHGLGPMNDQPRVIAMTTALGLVAVGGLAMRRMPPPDLGHYGATRRLEETSVRRLAIGLTLLVAAVGFVAGLAPADVLVASP